MQESEVSNRVSVEEGVAGKMAKHHQARARQRAEARQDLHEKAQAQVSLYVDRCYANLNNKNGRKISNPSHFDHKLRKQPGTQK